MPKPAHGGTWNRPRQAWEFTCEQCGHPFYRKRVRRKPNYCQDACRQLAYRLRNGLNKKPLQVNQVGPTHLK